MKKRLTPNIFTPYSLHIESEKDHSLLLKVIDVAIDTYTIRGLDTSDFEHLKDTLKEVPEYSPPTIEGLIVEIVHRDIDVR